ncbi:hypothetical protein SK128_019372, partial [Halocaridina rubra]
VLEYTPENGDPMIKKIKSEPEELLDQPEDAKLLDGLTDSYTVKEEYEYQDSYSKCQDPPKIDPKYVQVIASKDELNRRIKAFQQRKREELDVLNVQEFCTMSGNINSFNSCARTSAVVLRSKDSSSHLKLTRVVNEWGPQTLGKDPGSMPHSGTVEQGLDERLHNLESHLKISAGTPVSHDVYKRLKTLEDRVLHLEGISPEYFETKCVKIPGAAFHIRKEIKAKEDDLSIEDLDIEIHNLKMKLKERQLKHAF